MHETALAAGVIDIVRDALRERPAERVAVVRLSIGGLSHVEPRALEFCFDAAARGTPAEGARLAIDRPPGRAHCLTCDREVGLASRADACPGCGGHRLLVTGGEEMRVTELELA
ncbi:hydrogenase maturation nickel metallochaperone HypA [Paracraurococcus lichenis]|uniref:Hydrogenase maturation factor HypA n=1 Tax=Paracraurococcus lichenis TaxID=3064888 RepID=A0ABT9DZL7_9PROT|nr:hydrogenase maturation nickel metallochaperone HypA [Paracraurococcus sp. LOR1-02]MDO9709323.1 hydrogenase maturation nickel metallochaperone HypA [Paracraurococcus sp. LOR1-02]